MNSVEQDLTGVELARLFHEEAVAPLLARTLPGLRHTAGRFGHGSDVLGFDDRISRDHGWGPRVDLLLEEDAFEEARAAVDQALRTGLPARFRGYSTSYRNHVRVDVAGPPINHYVEIGSPEPIASLISELRGRIADPEVRALPRDLGSLDQLASCPDILFSRERRAVLAALYARRP